MIRSWILYFHSYRRMTSLGILPLMVVLTACLPWSQAGWAEKTLNLVLERSSNFLFLRSYLSLMYSFDLRLITFPVYGIVSWCPMYRFFQTSDSSNFLLEFQATCTYMSLHSLLGYVHKILNYEEWNLRPNFITGFIFLVENSNILYI